MVKLEGIYAPIPTPFIDEKIAFDKLKENLKFWGSSKMSGLVIAGSNGEMAFLSSDEKVELVRFVREHLPKSMQVIAGTGCETTQETIEVSQRAIDAGADAVLLIPPHYYKGAMNETVLKAYYTDVADALTGPVMIYNMPANTGLNISANVVCELANHPNIIGVKETSGNIVQISEIMARTPEDFALLAGSVSFFLPAIAMGAKGGILAAANVAPDDCYQILKEFNDGNVAEARRLQRKILPLNAAVTAGFGINGLKATLDMMGYFGGLARRPLLPLSEERREQLRKVLVEYGLPLV